jgi:uncharacterized protein (TIGR03435 family)
MTLLAIFTAVFNTFWQAAAVAVLVWLTLKCVRMNAATRCVIWWMVLGVLVLLPFAPRPALLRNHSRVLVAAPVFDVARVDQPEAAAIAESPAIVTLPEKPADKWPLAIFGIWAAVLVFRLTRIGQSYLFLRRVKRNSVPSDLRLPDTDRNADLLLSTDIASPMAVGFLHAAVIFPEYLIERITPGELDQILLHEAAHLARLDDWWNLLARFLGAILALHPVAWWILRQIEYEHEAACDDWVVARTGAVRPYAETLAHMAEMRWQSASSHRTEEALASGMFGRGSRIGDRIEGLLEAGRQFSVRVSAKRVIASCAALCCLAAAGSLAPRWVAFAQAPLPAPIAPIVQKQSVPAPLLMAQATTATPAPRPGAPAAPPQKRPLAFEVASIRPHDGPLHVIRGFSPSGPRLTLEGYNLVEFILEAYNLKNYQVSLGPAIALSDTYYDVVAKAEGDGSPTKAEFRQMLQALLAERFKFKFHREMKDIPVYALVVGKTGPKFRESIPEALEAAGATPVNLHGVNGRNQNITMSEASMESVADFIMNGLFADRPVLDKTGLTGKYNIKLEATPEFRMNNNPQPEDVSLFDAVQQQLGLRLESQKAGIEVLVVDHIEKPSEN